MAKRYSLDFYEKPFYEDSVTIHQMVECDEGEYVKYSDYEQLFAQIQQLQHRIGDLQIANALSERCLAEIKAKAVRYAADYAAKDHTGDLVVYDDLIEIADNMARGNNE